MATIPAVPTTLRSSLQQDGYVLLPSILSPSDLATLRSAAEHATSLARTGSWPFIRTLPKQFPPWTSTHEDGIWGVQHLLHPSLPHNQVFAKYYFNPTIITSVCEILSCEPTDLVLELYNLLVRPDADFALRWHRDDIAPDVADAEEERRLKEPIVHAQWNLALYDDASLIVVPGSHARARTQAERDADPYEDDMPGQKVVSMKAGDAVFYNNNILHRGVYSSKTDRMTLHGSMGVVGADPARARNVLQHGVGDWIDRCDFSGLKGEVGGQQLSRTAETMKTHLIAIGSSKHVGFSQSED